VTPGGLGKKGMGTEMGGLAGRGAFWEKTWKEYSADDKVAAYEEIIRWATGLENLEGKEVLDIGCGLGVSSYAAYRLSARKITGFDTDENVLELSKREIWAKKAGSSERWTLQQGSILDRGFIADLSSYDLIMAFGVFWMTGDFFTSLGNSLSLLRDGGTIIFSYSKKGFKTAVKERLNRFLLEAPVFLKNPVIYTVTAVSFLRKICILFFRGQFSQMNARNIFLSSYPWWTKLSTMESFPLDKIAAFCEQQGLEQKACKGERYQGEHKVIVFKKKASFLTEIKT